MMKYIYVILFVFVTHKTFGAQIRVVANYTLDAGQNSVLKDYTVITNNGRDQAEVRTTYSIADAQAKFGTLLNAGEVGTSQAPDRLFLDYDDTTGELKRISAQIISTSKKDTFEQAPVKQDPKQSLKDDGDVVKVDIETKTGKDIGGGDIKPPKDKPPPDPPPEP